MDRVTKHLLEDFARSQSFSRLSESQQFERFCNHCLISREVPETFNLEDVTVGSGGDGAIDGLAVLINGKLIAELDELDDVAKLNSYVDATFIFVQAKTSSEFDGAEILSFGNGVREFFNEAPDPTWNADLQSAHSLQGEVYRRSAAMRHGKPICKLFYASTGKWLNDPGLVRRREGIKKDLESLNIFRDVQVTFLGADELQNLYSRTKNRVSAEFQFPNRTALPEIEGVSEAYIGVLSLAEFLKLISDDTGTMRRTIFYDNVRDFQDYNDVNVQIQQTLKTGSERGRFAILNNGVTVVTQKLRVTGHKCNIEEFQVVNGCQTSHVLFNERHVVDQDSVFVPLRLIATQNDSITTSIIKATNSQTAVRQEQLEALSGFQKRLESFFSAFDGKKRLHYERRAGQYNQVSDIEKVRVIPMTQLIRSFTSMFLNEPHRVTRSYSSVLDDVGKKIFNAKHQLEPYYVAAYAYYKLEFMFRNGILDAKYKPARYHLLMAFRAYAGGADLPELTSNKCKRHCESIMAELWSEQNCQDVFGKAIKLIDRHAPADLSRDEIRKQPFTVKLARDVGM